MRYFRNFVILIILILSLIISKPALAQTLTPTPDPCSPDAPKSAPCPVPPDSTNVVIKLSQSWVSSFVSDIGQLLGIQANFSWNGTLNPADNKYPVAKNLPNLGSQLQQSGQYDLMPAGLQASVTPDLQPKPFTMASVKCVYNPQTGKTEQFQSTDIIQTEDIPGLRELETGSRQLGSYVTGYTQTSQDYNLKNVVTTNNVICDTIQPTGQPIEQTDIDTQNQNSYPASAQSNVLVNAVNAVIAAVQGLLKKYVVTETAQIQGKAVTPWIHVANCLFAGCKTSDVASVSYDDNKDRYVQAGGAVAAMYKPAAIDDSYKSAFDAADPNQQWNISGNGNTTSNVQGDQSVPATAVNFGQANIVAAGDYMNCALTPAGVQGPQCNQNWVSATAGSTAGGGWNCDTAVPPQSVPGLNIDAQESYVERLIHTCPDAQKNAWKMCANDVIARSKKACVDPLFTLAIWIHESTASNYTCGEKRHNGAQVQDFGVNGAGVPAEDFSKQLDKFLLLPGTYGSRCPKTLRDFFSQYGPSKGNTACYNQRTKTDRDMIDNYVNEVQAMYTQLGGGTMTWPQSTGCGN